MLTIPLKRSYEFAKEQIEKTKELADCYEFRLDTFTPLDFEKIKALTKLFDKPFIIALRKESQGGWFSNDIAKQLETLKKYLTLNPSYIDLEHDTPEEEVLKIRQEFPKVKIISSFHDFHQTPKDLEKMFHHVYRFPADIYKMVTTPSSTLDALFMLKFSKAMNDKGVRFVGICLGEKGEMTRVLGPVFGNVLNFASSDEEGLVASGQIPCQELCQIYNFKNLNLSTQVYALLGKPINQSLSHITHNRLFQELNLNAVYLRIALEKEDLKAFLNAALDSPFQGFSVTVPYKEALFKEVFYHDKIARKIQAINTLKKSNGQWSSTNTDAKGALDAIEQHLKVQNKTVIILGAGGTARAIAFEALYRKAKVKIINRTYEKALNIAKTLGCEAFSFKNLDEAFNEKYHVLINTTTVGMDNSQETPINKNFIEENNVVMDAIFKVKETKFLKDAKEKNCQIVFGYKMFAHQAISQFEFWFESHFDKKRLLNSIEKSYLQFIENNF